MTQKTLDLLNSLSFPWESQVHVARHLMEIPIELSSKLSKTEHLRIQAYDGSKFHQDFVQTPSELIDKIIQLGVLEKFKNVNYSNLELKFSFPIDAFPNGIRSRKSIKYASEKSTFQLLLVLHRSKNTWEVTTCFPV